jgi:hypothetical protein
MNVLETYLEELYVIRSSGGLYAAEQFQKQAKGALSGELREGQLPSRGAIEVKSTGEEVKNIARSEQVMRYVNRYK